MTQSLGGVKTDNQRVNQERRHLAIGLSGGSCFAYHLFLERTRSWPLDAGGELWLKRERTTTVK